MRREPGKCHILEMFKFHIRLEKKEQKHFSIGKYSWLQDVDALESQRRLDIKTFSWMSSHFSSV